MILTDAELGAVAREGTAQKYKQVNVDCRWILCQRPQFFPADA